MEAFSYCGYKIIGKESSLRQVLTTCGMVNIDSDDIKSILSSIAPNYVVEDIDDNVDAAFQKALTKIPFGLSQFKSLAIQVYIRDNQSMVKNDFVEIIKNLPTDLNWKIGLARDKTLIDKIKVTLIAAL